MAGIPGCAPRRYTHEEKVALVTEIDRRHRIQGDPLRVIANQLGTTDTSYSNWRKAGIEPVKEPRRAEANHPPYSATERERLLAEVDCLRGQGLSIVKACATAGISNKSYRKWKDDLAPPSAMRPVEITALVPVARAPVPMVTSKPAPETLSLLAPGGYRIEGLSVESAAALLRALG